MNRKWLRIIMLALILVVLILGALLFNIKIAKHPFKKHMGNSIEMQVKDGESIYNVIDRLDKLGAFNSGRFTKLYIRMMKNKPNNIKAGTYNVPSDSSMKAFIQEISKGTTITVTIPEGNNIEQIADVFEKKGIIGKDDFISACNKYELPVYIKNNSKRKYSLEGYLFPDTYEFNKGVSGNEIINIMLKRFEFQLKDVESKSKKAVKSDNIDDLIIMASIVEKEISSKEERAKAASVFYNRLSSGMKLQSCATVQYALGYHKDKLYDKDLKVDSPYNTYKVSKLPIGAICCPGRDAIEAALNPENTKFIYFVSKNDGTHIFTDNYKDFSEAKNRYQGGN